MTRGGSTNTLTEPWHTLAIQAGGVQALADVFGVSPSTIHRWAHGKRGISGPAAKLLAQLTAKLTKKVKP